MKTLEKFFLSIFTPSESNGQMLYYGLILFFLANIFVKDHISIIVSTVVVGIILGSRAFVQKLEVGLMDFVFGIAPAVLIYLEIIF